MPSRLTPNARGERPPPTGTVRGEGIGASRLSSCRDFAPERFERQERMSTVTGAAS